jgi:thioredoxin 1
MILRKNIIGISIILISLLTISCGKEKKDSDSGSSEQASEPASFIHTIASEDEFKQIVDAAGSKLLAFDLFATWCRPCRMLAPVLEKIAMENSSRVTFFKINVDKLPGIAQSFGVNGIPHIAFIKNKAVVENIVGMQPEQTYVEIIQHYAAQ